MNNTYGLESMPSMGEPRGMMPNPKDAQTWMWAQGGGYMNDSGIHSHANTGASSVISGTSSCQEGMMTFGNPFTPGSAAFPPSEHFDEMNEAARPQHIRAAMFPETMEDNLQMLSTQPATSIQGSLSESTQMLWPVDGNSEDFAELATRALPELVRLLNDTDPVVVGQAAAMVNQLSRRDGSVRALLGSPELMQAVVKEAMNCRDPAISKDTTGTLYSMSQHRQGLLVITRSGGVGALVRCLESPINSVVFYAIAALHNLLNHQEGAKKMVRQEGGIEKMVQLLGRPIPKLLAVVTDCLSILAFQNQESKIRILSCGGPEKLVNIMQNFLYEKLLFRTSHLFKVLSVCSQNKPTIIRVGGMQALAIHLNHPSQRLVQNCLWTLRNLSDAAVKEENVENLLVKLVCLLGSSDVEVVTCCAGILSNLTCKNETNKAILFRQGAIEYLLRTLQSHVNEEVLEPSLCALRHLMSRHPTADTAQSAFLQLRGLEAVAHFLRSGRLPLIKAALGIVRNLAANHLNYASLRLAGALQMCLEAFQQLQRAQAQAKICDGINVVDVLATATGAIHLLAKDHSNAVLIRQMQLIPPFVNLLSSEHESIQKGACGVLYEVSSDPEGAQALGHQAAVALTKLLSSKNESISTYAAAVLCNVNGDRNRFGGDPTGSRFMDQDFTPSWSQMSAASRPPVGFQDFGEMQPMSEDPFAEMMDQHHQGGLDPMSPGWTPSFPPPAHRWFGDDL